MRNLFLFCLLGTLLACQQPVQYDTIIRNGMIYDGLGGEPYKGDIGINADTIAFVGDLSNAKGKQEIDAAGKAVSPGFINMLSWAVTSLIADGRSMSDIKQGVTTEIFGEGSSMGPLNEKMKQELKQGQSDIKFDVNWTSLAEYLSMLQQKGISCNVASFIGAETVRVHVMGEDDRDPTPAEMDSMKALVRTAMAEGALGVGSSLIYPPAFFAKTNELVELCKAASPYGGMYISHMRSEGNRFLEALEELITISKEANIPAEVYHLKAAGKDNWYKMDSAIRRIERARNEGLNITADMYNYEAGATGLTSAFPPSLQDGGFGKLVERLKDPAIRMQMKKAMNTNATDWENLYYSAGSPEKVLLIDFTKDSLKKYAGKSLAAVAQLRGQTVEDCAIDLIIQDSSRIGTAYFLMNESNTRKQIALPFLSFGSDAASYPHEGVFLQNSQHPRANGNVARLLGKYVRDEKVISLQEAIRKLTSLPATNLKLQKRGQLKPGYFADVVVFDPATIQDHATFEKPHQYATGVAHVWVNGMQVLKDGEHTKAMPGKALKGPGFKEN
jgi:N-acyl-D-amino-acid deacylase